VRITRREKVLLGILSAVAAVAMVTVLLMGASTYEPSHSDGHPPECFEPHEVPFDERYLVIRAGSIWSLGKDGAKGKSAKRLDLPDPGSVEAVTFIAYHDNATSSPQRSRRTPRTAHSFGP